MTEPCADKTLLIQADLDGELDIASSAALALHVQTCPGCAALQHDLAQLSERIRAEIPPYAAPASLRRQFSPTRRPTQRPTLWRRPAAWTGMAAGALLAASLVLLLPTQTPDPLGPLVASHIRALQPGHLVDVESTDQHTVKPWFDGRIDFAPPVKDLAAQGFPLLGGRLDYLAPRTVAALAYRRDRHPIDLYIQPGTTQATESSRNGYNIITWSEAGLALQAISDLNPAELREFVRIWRQTP